MSENLPVVLDACVLCNYTLCDLLLRLAEPPRLFLPRWSDEIIEETARTQRVHLRWEEHLVQSFHAALKEHFPDCWVKNYKPLVKEMTNHEKDRHVAAAAVRCGASTIVTQNFKHFREADMKPWKITARHPDQFLEHLLSLHAIVVVQKMKETAQKRRLTFEMYLQRIGKLCPIFAKHVRSS